MAVEKGDRVLWHGELWEVTRVWNTNTEGYRADMRSVEQPASTCSVNVDELVRVD